MAELPEVVSLALGIAISPLPVVALLLMLLSPTGFRSGIGFAAGWTAGIACAVTAFSLLSELLPDGANDRDGILRFLPLLLGVGLSIVGTVRLIGYARTTPRPGPPGWIGLFDTVRPVRATAIGFAYAAFKPKNLVLAAAAAVIIFRGGGAISEVALTVLVYCAVASVTLWGPVIGVVAGGDGMRRVLDGWRAFLLRYLSPIGSGAFVFLGIALTLVAAAGLVG